MGLKGIFQAGAELAFSIAGDVKKSATYSSITNNGIDAATSVDFTVEFVPGSFTTVEKMLNDNILRNDSTALVLVADMSVEPKQGDKLVEGTNTYTVIDFETDAAEATYSLHIRKA